MALVFEWYDVATAGGALPDNVFFRFLALWVAFNGLYSFTFPKALTDAAQIRSFGNWIKAKAAHARILADNDPSYRAAISTLQQRGVFNYLTDKVEHIIDPQDLQDVIGGVYLVRCNLFHGRKVPSNLRDRKLVEACHVVVSQLMRSLLNTTASRQEPSNHS